MIPMPVGVEHAKQEDKMKKFLVVLLSLGLIVAFSAVASAADATIKMSGTYYLQGNYINNQMAAGDDANYSRAYIHQRARVQTDLGVVEGLSFRFRFDAMEKQWGQTDWKNNYQDQSSSKRATSPAGNPKIQESIELDQTMMFVKTAVGQFQIGYQTADQWGLDFASSGTTRPRVLWTMPMGNFIMGALYEKFFESDKTQVTTYPKGNRTDTDVDAYGIFGTFKYTGGDAGLLLKYYNDRSHRADTVAAAPGQGGYKSTMYQVAPYARAAFGPFYIETELEFFGGDIVKWETGGAVPNRSLSSWGAYVMGKFTTGPAAFGVLISNSTGDNGKDPSKDNQMPAGSGTDFNPALLLMNDTLVGQGDSPLGSTSNPTGVTNTKYNVLIANAFATFKATPKLDFGAAFTWAKVNEKKTALSDELGFEFDVTASYKIYDNLTYKVGAGYLWTGDYFKGASATKAIGNDYLLMNNLQIVF
jgi:hypothetical protein